MSPRPNFWGRLRPALIFELGRIGSEHLPNDLPRDPKLPADRLDRPLLNEIRPADLRNRLHDQHPELGLHVPWKPVWTLIPGVPLDADHPENGVLIPRRFTLPADFLLEGRRREVRRRVFWTAPRYIPSNV